MVDVQRAAQLAQCILCRALGPRSPSVRANLPFDPGDEEDVACWVRGELAQLEWQSEDTTSYACQRVVWDGLALARRGTKLPPVRCLSDSPMMDSDAGEGADPWQALGIHLEARPSVTLGFMHEMELAEELAVAASEVAYSIQHGRNRNATFRKGTATLSCLLRVAYEVTVHLCPRAGQFFRETLIAQISYRKLLLRSDERRRFEECLKRIQASGNFRRDFAYLGFCCSGAKQWREFVCALLSRLDSREAQAVISRRERRCA